MLYDEHHNSLIIGVNKAGKPANTVSVEILTSLLQSSPKLMRFMLIPIIWINGVHLKHKHLCVNKINELSFKLKCAIYKYI